MNISRLLIFGFILTFFASFTFAYGMVANTYNSNQNLAGSVYIPSSPYSGWVYNAYTPNPGYPVLGGGVYYPPGYGAGYYYPSYNAYGYGYNAYPSPSYPGHYVSGYYNYAPVHSTYDVGYVSNNYYLNCTYYC